MHAVCNDMLQNMLAKGSASWPDLFEAHDQMRKYMQKMYTAVWAKTPSQMAITVSHGMMM